MYGCGTIILDCDWSVGKIENTNIKLYTGTS